VIGAGPAGLTAAYELVRLGQRPLLLEAAAAVGGLARTEEYRGFRFDMGGHRFYTKSRSVLALWREVLGSDLLRRSRLSRIYYRGRLYPYPLQIVPTLTGLGARESMLILLSWARAQVDGRAEQSFEDWVCRRFGERLYRTFFKTYTEKVWGRSCTELRAEWAAQRLKDLSMLALMRRALRLGSSGARTLTDHFYYPRRGPGMMWNAVKDAVERGGGTVRCGVRIERVLRRGRRVVAVETEERGRRARTDGDAFISSMPISELVKKLDPAPPAAALDAARSLRYRDFLTVCLIVKRERLFDDNWIYVHEPGVRVARIQNFKNWSPDMVPDPRFTSLGLEYFCEQGDACWRTPDHDLVELGRRELAALGLAEAREIVDGCVFRVPKAYPVYDASYAERLATLRSVLNGIDNLQSVGRNGLHRYNNQDHSMLCGLLAARNAALGEHNDVWSVNADAEYLEEAPRNAASRRLARAPRAAVSTPAE
jgi:protoporphyrinogen oxidase